MSLQQGTPKKKIYALFLTKTFNLDLTEPLIWALTV